MPLSSKSGRAGLCKQAAAAPQGWLLLPAVKSSCSSHPPPVGPPAARQDHKNIGGTPTWSGLHQAPAACLKQRGGITATWQRTSLGKSRPRARVQQQLRLLKMLHRQGFNRQPAPILLKAGLWSLGPNRLIGRTVDLHNTEMSKLKIENHKQCNDKKWRINLHIFLSQEVLWLRELAEVSETVLPYSVQKTRKK